VDAGESVEVDGAGLENAEVPLEMQVGDAVHDRVDP
jgi:hypothetical protein